MRWPRAGASYLMWARRPWVFYIKTSVKSQTFRNLYLLTSSNSPKVVAAARAPGRRSCGPKKLRMVLTLMLEQKAEETEEADAGAAVARACGVINK